MSVVKNQDYTVTIADMTTEGEGIGKVDGFPLFVKDTVVGDVARVRAIKVKKNYGYGRLMEVLTPSADRVEAACPLARQCGGCTLQAMSYEAQLEWKRRKIEGNLKRIGGFLDLAVGPVIGMEHPWRYRNKTQVPFGTAKDGSVTAGFYAGRTHSIIPCEDCLLSPEINEEILSTIRTFMTEFKIPAYNEETGTGIVRHALIRNGFYTGQIMVCLVINSEMLPHAEELVARLGRIPGMASVCLNINREKTNVILGSRVINLYGPGYLEDCIGELTFRISPLSFFQVNPQQTKKLYETALSFADLTGNEIVWDLYCGIGTISLFLAQKAKKVYGVEIIPAAIDNARENAVRNHLENTEFFVGKAEEVLPDWYREHGERADIIVVDPPRKGCEESLLATIVQMSPKRVVYVSCDSATLARDLKYLAGNGYRVENVQGVDMFPWSGHVETVCLLSKLNAKQHIEVEIKMDELDLTSAKSKATYDEIKVYILQKYGLKVSSLYIAQVKQKCGIIERENYNKAKSGDAKQPQCPPEKEAAIKEALIYFQML